MKKVNFRKHFPKTIALAYPVMLSQLGHIMVGVADSMMVGRLGATPLAAASMGNVIFHLLMAFGIGLSYGITPLVSSAMGAGDKTHLLKVSHNVSNRGGAEIEAGEFRK